MRRKRLLDLYCCRGGAGMGWHRAGFEVVGIDINPQPDYPFEFHRGDAIEYLLAHHADFDAVHASPPCQGEGAPTKGTNKARNAALGRTHPHLIAPTREALDKVGLPYVIENVAGSEVRKDLMLCGEMFELGVLQHRYFELSGWTIAQPPHPAHRGKVRGWRHGAYHEGPYVAAYGKGGGKATVAEMQAAKGIDWTSDHEALREAIPPAYTEHIGRHLAAFLDNHTAHAPEGGITMARPDDHPTPTLATEDRPVSGLPRNRQAEQAVIGAALLSPTTLKELLGMIEPGDLYEISHEIIWGAIERLAARGKPVDAVSVAAELGRDAARLGREMGETAGPVYLHTCMDAVPNAASGPYYAELLRDYAYARRVVNGGIRLAQMGRTEIEDDLKAAVRRELQTIAEADRRGWDDPIPLNTVRALPPFPLGSLPTWLQAEVEAVAHETQTPPDLAATVALSVLATAAGGKARVDVRPGVRWSEPTNLYTVAALPPGTRKSPVFKAMLKPLRDAEKQLREDSASDRVAKTVARKVAEETAARTADAAAKASLAERDGLLMEAQAAAEALEATTVPAKPQLIAGNATVETIASLLAEQGGRLAILSAESEIFSIMAGRYSGGNAAIDVFLYGHAGDEMRTNRKTRAEEEVEDPALTLGICTQPSTLATLGGIEGSEDRGLFARFLYTIPEVRLGYRETDPEPRDPAIHDTYHANIKALTLSLAELREPIRLTLSPKAQEMQAALSADNEKRLRPDGELAGIPDWAGKAVGACMRIAGLLHLAEHLKDGYARPISFETVTAAVELIEYYTQHALAAYDKMSADPTADRAHALLTWIRNTGAARFTSRDAFRSQSRNRFPKMTDLDPALILLEQHGYLRRLAAAPTAGRGRPQAAIYETHPDTTGT